LEALGAVDHKLVLKRCLVCIYRIVFSVMPRGMMKKVAALLKDVHALEYKPAALKKVKDVASKFKETRLYEAAKKVEDTAFEALNYCDFPREHWRQILSNIAMGRLKTEDREYWRFSGSVSLS